MISACNSQKKLVPNDWGAASYVVILQAGEQLVPHAMQILAHEIERHQCPDILYADEDHLQSDGVRSGPVFKPQPNVLLMCSGTLSGGVWLVRRDLLPDDLSTVVGMPAEIVGCKAGFGPFARTERARRSERRMF